MKLIKSILVEDNTFMATVLSDLLQENHPEIEIIGIAINGKEGLEKIKQLQPDLVFLDIEMPDMTGFEMLNRIETINFQTIFITAHSHYAIKAFRFNALDYLLKPIDKKELAQAIKRHTTNSTLTANKNQVHQALINQKIKKVEDQFILLQTQQGTLQLALKNIIKIESERNYSYIHLSDNTKVLSAKTLGYFENILSEMGFFRSHRSFLINWHHINFLSKSDFILKDQTKVLVSRRKRSEAKNWFHSYR